MFLPPAPQKYNQTNENQARKLIREAIDGLEARLTAAIVEPEPPPPNDPPTAQFRWTATGLTVQFTDESSDVSPGFVVAFAWDFGDSGSSSARNPQHVYQTPGTYTVVLVVTDDTGNQSSPFTQQVTVESGLRMFFAAQNSPPAQQGTEPWPDTWVTNTNGAALVRENGLIDVARAAGARLYVRPFTNTQIVDANRFYSLSLNIQRMNEWIAEVRSINRVINGVNKNGEQILREAVRDKVFVFLYTHDDWTSAGSGENQMASIPTFEDLEGGVVGGNTVIGLHQHIKSIWPWMPIVPRARNSYMKQLATRNGVVRRYRWTDAGWAQWRGDLDPHPSSTFATNEVNDGIACGLGWVGGVNILNGGDWVLGTHPISGATTFSDGTPMRVHADTVWRAPLGGETLFQYDERMHPEGAKIFGMSPQEIVDVGGDFVSNLSNYGFTMWSFFFNQNYFLRSDIRAAIQTVFNQAELRTDGPLNIRGDLPAA